MNTSLLGIEPLHKWLPIKGERALIAGPCSLESFDQLDTIASQLLQIEAVSALRVGIWKPRSRPGGFEGVGDKGLAWVKEIKARYPLKIATEVATPEHIEKGLGAGVDFFWVGARTSGNPFSISELCEAIKGLDIPILIKNPMISDLNLWIGCIERFYQAGCRKIAAVHRGYHLYNNDKYRNAPCWELPIELKRLFPDLPLLCDPSHIAGKKEFVLEISQKAMDLKYAGLMIEVHPNPDEALTDREQQLTPSALTALLKKLIFRQELPSHAQPSDRLAELREQIDQADRELLQTLARRMEVVRSLAYIKNKEQLSILQLERWNAILENSEKLSNELQLDFDFIKRIMELIHGESIQIQNELMNLKSTIDE